MAFVEIFTLVASKGGASATQQLMKTLLQMDTKLNVLEKRLAKLQESPYVAGLGLLKKAAVTNDLNRREKLISDAAGRFNDAVSQIDGSMKALAYFYSGCCYDLLSDENLAVNEYLASFRSACGFDFTERSISTDKAKLINRIKLGTTGVGAAVGGAGGAGLTLLLASGVPGAIPATTVALPALAMAAGAGMLIGGSPFYFTSKAGELAVNLYARKHAATVESFFVNFTQPAAALLVVRNLKSPARPLVDEVHRGVRPDLSVLQSYLEDESKWEIEV